MLKLHGYFRDGAILQRGKPLNVSGYADGKVKCFLKGDEVCFEASSEAKSGIFEVTFPPVSDTETLFRLEVYCGEENVCVNIRFGDVYLTAGQSNMSYALSAVEAYTDWSVRAEKTDIAILDLREPTDVIPEQVERPVQPQCDFIREYKWRSGKEDLSELSALSVMMAVLLSENEKVPIGVVHTAMGGLSAEAYVSRQTAEADTALIAYLKKNGRYSAAENYNQCGNRNFTQISGVFNEKISPLKGFAFKGIVWYLGESSAYDFRCAKIFKKLMGMVIADFSSIFGKIPFVAVHIAPEYYPYGDRYGYLYVNEVLTSLQSENVTVVPTYDIDPRWLKPDGDLYYHPIHTVNKAPVAQRIADVLGGKRAFFPSIIKEDFKEGFVEAEICGGILQKKKFQGFTVAGENGKYYPAQAFAVSATKIRIWSDEVAKPCSFTYAFLQYQDFCDVKTEEGLPLLPYRSRIEKITDKYFMIPAYSVAGANEVYENCFGWNVGICHKVPVWSKGVIYDAGSVKIKVKNDCVQCENTPDAQKYFLFGISPNICLSGHKNHIADFKFWNFTLSAEMKAEFIGVMVRSANGEVFRADLYSGTEKMSEVHLTEEAHTFSVCWESGVRGDGAPVLFSKKDRQSFVQAEFVFRSKNAGKITLKNLYLSDKNNSQSIKSFENHSLRSDIVLPKNS